MQARKAPNCSSRCRRRESSAESAALAAVGCHHPAGCGQEDGIVGSSANDRRRMRSQAEPERRRWWRPPPICSLAGNRLRRHVDCLSLHHVPPAAVTQHAMFGILLHQPLQHELLRQAPPRAHHALADGVGGGVSWRRARISRRRDPQQRRHIAGAKALARTLYARQTSVRRWSRPSPVRRRCRLAVVTRPHDSAACCSPKYSSGGVRRQVRVRPTIHRLQARRPPARSVAAPSSMWNSACPRSLGVIEQQAVRRQSVTPGAADLLVVVLDAVGQVCDGRRNARPAC